MPAATKDKTTLILEATLDAFTHPVWIMDTEGLTYMNSGAQRLVAEGVSLKSAISKKAVNHKGAKFSVTSRELNHGTHCVMYEVAALDDDASRLRNCANLLDKALKK